MCVIIVKPANKLMPSETTLRRAMRTNPDGFGFCTPTRYFKTLNKAEFLHELSKVDESEPCIIHCRYATHGSVKKANCHPFKGNGIFFAHNGILNVSPIGDMTDSETAFRTMLLPCIKRNGMDSPEFYDLCDALCGGYSRFAFLSGGELYVFGDFVHRSDSTDSCLYSNLRFDYDISTRLYA